jgi:hypothetical protein
MRLEAEEAVPNLLHVIARKLEADEAISGGWRSVEGVVVSLSLP